MKEKPVYIDIKLLKDMKVCSPGIAKFKSYYGNKKVLLEDLLWDACSQDEEDSAAALMEYLHIYHHINALENEWFVVLEDIPCHILQASTTQFYRFFVDAIHGTDIYVDISFLDVCKEKKKYQTSSYRGNKTKTFYERWGWALKELGVSEEEFRTYKDSWFV